MNKSSEVVMRRRRVDWKAMGKEPPLPIEEAPNRNHDFYTACSDFNTIRAVYSQEYIQSHAMNCDMCRPIYEKIYCKSQTDV